MLSHAAYKVLHLIAIFILFGGLGGFWAISAASDGNHQSTARRLLLASHGLALLLILFAGFGMLARLGILAAWPLWVWIKLSVWLLIGALPVLLRRVERAPNVLFFLAPLLGAIAAYAAIFHPGHLQ